MAKKKEIYKDDILMSLCIVLKRFDILRVKYRQDKILKDNCFKREREAWISALCALAMTETQIKKNERSIKIETKDQTPDNYIIGFVEENGKRVKEIAKIEIVQWEDHVRCAHSS